MQILRKGSSGSDVENWQTFLRGLRRNSLVLISGNFEDITESETKVFQAKKGLPSDGVVGPKTLAAALRSGFSLMHDPDCDIDGPNWPARPTCGPLTSIDRGKLFGNFAYKSASTATNPEAIIITDDWASKNIVSIEIPQLKGVVAAPSKVSIHKLVASQTLRIFEQWEQAGLKDRLLTWGGSWVPRFIRGSRTHLSNHAWGTAFDINVRWNMLGAQPALRGQKGSVRELVQIAYENGYYWGGHFHKRMDGMHFEARIIVA